MNTSIKELKRSAREKLLGNYGILIGASILYSILSRVLMSILGAPFQRRFLYAFLSGNLQPADVFPYYGVLYFCVFIASFVGIGWHYMNYRIARGEKTDISDLFFVFTHKPGSYIKLLFLQIGILLLCAIPVVIGCVALFVCLSIDQVVLGIIFYAAGLIAYLILVIREGLRLSCCYYIYFDNNAMPARKVVRLSRQLMDGNIMKLFKLNISFIPIVLLSILSLGIASLWLNPYIVVTKSNFYLSLIGRGAKAKPDWRPYISKADFSDIYDPHYNPYNKF